MNKIPKRKHKLYILLKITILLFVVWFISYAIYSTVDGLKNNQENADTALVLGNQVYADGTLSKRLQARVDRAVYLYDNGKVKHIIVSGGTGKEGYPEGTAMKNYLLTKNIPETDITVDDKGYNTLASVKNTLELKSILDFDSITVVSQYFHITRSKMLFRKEGFYNIQSSSPLYFELRDLYSIFREFIAYYKYRFIG